MNKEANGDFVSVPFTTAKTAFRFRVEYKRSDAERNGSAPKPSGRRVFLETKIDENSTDWVFVKAVATAYNSEPIIEETVGGVIPGQLFRIITAGPSKIGVLD